MSVFIDTSAFYSFLAGAGSEAGRVERTMRRLLEADRPFCTTSYVVVETVALLQRRIGLDAVRDFADKLLPLCAVEWVTEGLYRRGITRLFRANQRDLSLVDCVSFEFLESEGIRDVVALDRHFAQAGFKLLV